MSLRNCPPSVAHLTVLKSNQIKAVQDIGKILKGLALLLTILVPLLYAIAIFARQGLPPAHAHERRLRGRRRSGVLVFLLRTLVVNQVTDSLVKNRIGQAGGARGDLDRDLEPVGNRRRVRRDRRAADRRRVVRGSGPATPRAAREFIAPFLRDRPEWTYAIVAAIMLLIFIWNPIPSTGKLAGSSCTRRWRSSAPTSYGARRLRNFRRHSLRLSGLLALAASLCACSSSHSQPHEPTGPRTARVGGCGSAQPVPGTRTARAVPEQRTRAPHRPGRDRVARRRRLPRRRGRPGRPDRRAPGRRLGRGDRDRPGRRRCPCRCRWRPAPPRAVAWRSSAVRPRRRRRARSPCRDAPKGRSLRSPRGLCSHGRSLPPTATSAIWRWRGAPRGGHLQLQVERFYTTSFVRHELVAAGAGVHACSRPPWTTAATRCSCGSRAARSWRSICPPAAQRGCPTHRRRRSRPADRGAAQRRPPCDRGLERAAGRQHGRVPGPLRAKGVTFGAPRLLESFANPHGVAPPPASPSLIRLSTESVMLAWSSIVDGRWVIRSAAVDQDRVGPPTTTCAANGDALLADVQPGPRADALLLWTEPAAGATQAAATAEQAIYATRGFAAWAAGSSSKPRKSSPGRPPTAKPRWRSIPTATAPSRYGAKASCCATRSAKRLHCGERARSRCSPALHGRPCARPASSERPAYSSP